jgi:hypothetical protein
MFHEKLQLPCSGLKYLLENGNTYINLALGGEWKVKPGPEQNKVAEGYPTGEKSLRIPYKNFRNVPKNSHVYVFVTIDEVWIGEWIY